MEQFTLINKQRNRIKIFKKFKSTLPQAKEVIEIEYACVYKRSSKPVIKGSRIETLEKAIWNNLSNYLQKFGEKPSSYNIYL